MDLDKENVEAIEGESYFNFNDMENVDELDVLDLNNL